ncbi:MAG: 4-(cytidine 5'-diphospho)-2-C-methyl-D-erythritol kinase [Chloroflexota bacterium]
MSTLTVLAPAKINLTLEVLGKRPDGFHEIRSVMQTIDRCDRLTFQPAANIECRSDLAEWAAEQSLVSKAATLLQTTTGCSQGATITVNKRIPLLSGLGGDSSDAAATLRGLNRLWDLRLSPEELLKLAPRLGSDVAFFLYGGTALAEGRGEIITPLPPLPHSWVVLVTPPVPREPGKTRMLYGRLDASHHTDGQITERLVRELKEDKEFNPSLLFNTFENVAFDIFPEAGSASRRMTEIGNVKVYLAGSGPTLYALVKDKAQAWALFQRLKQQGLEPYLTETLAELAPIKVE